MQKYTVDTNFFVSTDMKILNIKGKMEDKHYEQNSRSRQKWTGSNKRGII